MPKYVLLTFSKGQLFAFSDSGLWACYSLNHVRTLAKNSVTVDGYQFNLIDFEGSLMPWYRGKEVLFSGYAEITQK